MAELQKNIATKKEFGYKKREVNLNFVLNIDNLEQLKDFEECLIEARKDVRKIIDNS